jgi:SAM-dependent methyltransferase
MHDSTAWHRHRELLKEIRDYWNTHIHDLEIATQPTGTPGFFRELAVYREDKLRYLSETVDFLAYEGFRVLEVGCGLGIDLARFSEGGAQVVGVDLAERAVQLALDNFEQGGLDGNFAVMNGEGLAVQGSCFDVVYAHGVIQYTADGQRLVDEIYRVLKPGGTAILMVYNRRSWLALMSNLTGVRLEHEDAPVMNQYTAREFQNLLQDFASVRIIPERFPVKTQLHGGFKGLLFNSVFVPLFDLIPRAWTRSVGWHLIAKAVK